MSRTEQILNFIVKGSNIIDNSNKKNRNILLKITKAGKDTDDKAVSIQLGDLKYPESGNVIVPAAELTEEKINEVLDSFVEDFAKDVENVSKANAYIKHAADVDALRSSKIDVQEGSKKIVRDVPMSEVANKTALVLEAFRDPAKKAVLETYDAEHVNQVLGNYTYIKDDNEPLITINNVDLTRKDFNARLIELGKQPFEPVVTETQNVEPVAPTVTEEPTVAPFVPAGIDETVEQPEAPAETVEAPVEQPEVPAETVEAPVEQPEVPAETVEAPVEQLEVPAETVDTPVEQPEVPAKTVEAPVEQSEVPTETVDTPVEDVVQPTNEVDKELEKYREYLKSVIPANVYTDDLVYNNFYVHGIEYNLDDNEKDKIEEFRDRLNKLGAFASRNPQPAGVPETAEETVAPVVPVVENTVTDVVEEQPAEAVITETPVENTQDNVSPATEDVPAETQTAEVVETIPENVVPAGTEDVVENEAKDIVRDFENAENQIQPEEQVNNAEEIQPEETEELLEDTVDYSGMTNEDIQKRITELENQNAEQAFTPEDPRSAEYWALKDEQDRRNEGVYYNNVLSNVKERKYKRSTTKYQLLKASAIAAVPGALGLAAIGSVAIGGALLAYSALAGIAVGSSTFNSMRGWARKRKMERVVKSLNQQFSDLNNAGQLTNYIGQLYIDYPNISELEGLYKKKNPDTLLEHDDEIRVSCFRRAKNGLTKEYFIVSKPQSMCAENEISTQTILEETGVDIDEEINIEFNHGLNAEEFNKQTNGKRSFVTIDKLKYAYEDLGGYEYTKTTGLFHGPILTETKVRDKKTGEKRTVKRFFEDLKNNFFERFNYAKLDSLGIPETVPEEEAVEEQDVEELDAEQPDLVEDIAPVEDVNYDIAETSPEDIEELAETTGVIEDLVDSNSAPVPEAQNVEETTGVIEDLVEENPAPVLEVQNVDEITVPEIVPASEQPDEDDIIIPQAFEEGSPEAVEMLGQESVAPAETAYVESSNQVDPNATQILTQDNIGQAVDDLFTKFENDEPDEEIAQIEEAGKRLVRS